ncbi:MAG: hypothetical protein ABIV28_04825, partial [Longimicrobiales bacterium]
MDNPWQRIRERKLVQWSFAYIAVSWAALQGLDFLAGHFGSWDAIVRAATVFLAVNYIAVLLIAIRHGEQGRQRVTSGEIAIVSTVFLAACGAAFVAGSRTPDRNAPLAA